MLAIPTPPTLRDRIESIHLAGGDTGGRLVLPSNGMVLGFQLSGAVAHDGRRLEPLGVTGLLRRGRRFQYHAGTVSVLIRFRPGAGAALGVPARELYDQSTALDALLDRPLRPVAARILQAGSLEGALAALTALLWRIPWSRDAVVEAALQALDDSRDAGGVAAVARSLQISERQLSRRFLASVGIAPKRYAGLRRFERAALAMRSRSSMVQVALESGYYDQPHLAREIRSFADMTPRELWRSLR
jgi:AraC-like DNA-binding protein